MDAFVTHSAKPPSSDVAPLAPGTTQVNESNSLRLYVARQLGLMAPILSEVGPSSRAPRLALKPSSRRILLGQQADGDDRVEWLLPPGTATVKRKRDGAGAGAGADAAATSAGAKKPASAAGTGRASAAAASTSKKRGPRSKSAFTFFFQESRTALAARFSDLSPAALRVRAKELFGEMTTEARQPWEEKAQADRARVKALREAQAATAPNGVTDAATGTVAPS